MDASVPVESRHGSRTGARAMARWRRVAWLVIVVADVGLLAWAAMAALVPQHLPGPAAKPILPAGYQGFTGASWQHLTATAPKTADYTALLFRMYGIYGVGLSLLAIAVGANAFRRGERWAWWALLVGNTIGYGAAMVYDQIVNAVGPFELSEYLGLAVIYGSLAITLNRRRPLAGAS
jgi:MFS-type transporter involved in bile tolerance (Atg22 family)